VRENFERCLNLLLAHEGGFVNHPKDPGGMTNLGVTKKVYEEFVGRDVDEQEMRGLTPEDVAPLYKALYWDKVRGDHLPSGVDWAVFDWGVNSGTGRAAKALQNVLGTTPDGAIGPKTLSLASVANAKAVIYGLHEARQTFYESLSTFETFGRGWTRRNDETRDQAMEMA